eukprot:SAG31_NODE_17084_length_684_cov_0.952137_1_plen_34_part_10
MRERGQPCKCLAMLLRKTGNGCRVLELGVHLKPA